jgi:hypothetical protein
MYEGIIVMALLGTLRSLIFDLTQRPYTMQNRIGARIIPRAWRKYFLQKRE